MGTSLLQRILGTLKIGFSQFGVFLESGVQNKFPPETRVDNINLNLDLDLRKYYLALTRQKSSRKSPRTPMRRQKEEKTYVIILHVGITSRVLCWLWKSILGELFRTLVFRWHSLINSFGHMAWPEGMSSYGFCYPSFCRQWIFFCFWWGTAGESLVEIRSKVFTFTISKVIVASLFCEWKPRSFDIEQSIPEYPVKGLLTDD